MNFSLVLFALFAITVSALKFHFYDLPTKSTTLIWPAGQTVGFTTCMSSKLGSIPHLNATDGKYQLVLRSGSWPMRKTVTVDSYTATPFGDSIVPSTPVGKISKLKKFTKKTLMGKKPLCYVVTFLIPSELKTGEYRMFFKRDRSYWFAKKYNKSPKFFIAGINKEEDAPYMFDDVNPISKYVESRGDMQIEA